MSIFAVVLLYFGVDDGRLSGMDSLIGVDVFDVLFEDP